MNKGGERQSAAGLAGNKEPALAPARLSPQRAPPNRKRVRLPPEERERMILEGALRFFAERGFAADTRDLARTLGVSQSLIYRYFGNKENLLERVYEQTFIARWKDSWEPLLRDRGVPLGERLRHFYLDYFNVVDDPIWIRIAMRSSLAGHTLTRRYVEGHIELLLTVIADEARHATTRWNPKFTGHELELAWHLHSTLIYYLIRKYIHRLSVSNDIPGLIEIMVENFLTGISAGVGLEANVEKGNRRRTGFQ
jgi:AcrR family transcriptional regulator